MKTRAALAAAAFLAFAAGTGGHAAPEKEVSVSELMERFPALMAELPPPPKLSEAEVSELEQDDPQIYTFIRGATSHPPGPVRLGGDGRLALMRPESGEQIVAAYRGKDGTYDQAEIGKVNRLMRCRLTGRETAVSIKLLEILDAVEDKFGGNGLILLSGYRSPVLNRQVRGAARWSMHMLGWAADIRVPGTSAAKVTAFARKLGAGGVGAYPDADFTHLDSGRSRHWVVRRRAAAKPQAAGTKK